MPRSTASSRQPATNPVLSLGDLADTLFTLREEKNRINALVSTIETRIKAAEADFLTEAEKAGTTIARGKLATVSVSETEKPIVVDWDAFYAFLIRRKAPHLLQRRIAEGAYAELRASLNNKDAPGVDVFKHKGIRITKL